MAISYATPNKGDSCSGLKKFYGYAHFRGRVRSMRKLTNIYFAAVKWTVLTLDRQARRAQTVCPHVFGEEELAAMGIYHIDDLPGTWFQHARYISCNRRAIGKSCVISDESLRPRAAESDLTTPPDRNDRVNSVHFDGRPTRFPWDDLFLAMRRLHEMLEPDLKLTGIAWRSAPAYQGIRYGHDVCAFLRAKRPTRDEFLFELEKTRRQYQDDLGAALCEYRRGGDAIAPAEDTAATHVASEDDNARRPKRGRGMTQEEANLRARELLNDDPGFRNKTLREWALAIGCSGGLVSKLPVWRAIMEEDDRGQKSKGARRPRTVSLTETVEARAGVTVDPAEAADADGTLRALIEQATPEERAHMNKLPRDEVQELTQAYKSQLVDTELSPLEDDPPTGPPKRVRTYKSL